MQAQNKNNQPIEQSAIAETAEVKAGVESDVIEAAETAVVEAETIQPETINAFAGAITAETPGMVKMRASGITKTVPSWKVDALKAKGFKVV